MPKTRTEKTHAVIWLQEHVSYTGDDCLIWPFSRSQQRGYGWFFYKDQKFYAHRMMCELVNGPAPAGKPQASHSCGKGHLGCVHPGHLSWKSNSENQLDRRKHGTVQPRPVRLTALQIEAARLLRGQMTIEKIAAMFGVKRGCIEYWHRHDQPPQRHNNSRGKVHKVAQRMAFHDEQSKEPTP